MTKARTLANFISDGSTLSDGAISVSEVSGAAPLASPSFTGNLTVDTDTLFVNSSANRLGVLTSAPDAELHISSSHPHIDLGPKGSNRAKLGFRYDNLYLGATSGGGEVILKNNISSTDAPDASGDEIARFGDSIVFNESGRDQDFRVESDGNTHALFVDAANNRVGINNNAPSGMFTVNLTGTGSITNNTQTKLTDYLADSRMGFTGRANNNDGVYFGMESIPSGIGFLRENSGWDTQMRFYTNNITSGPDGTNAMQEKMRIWSSGVTINETGADYDFRVESDSNTHMLFVDASANKIGVGTSSLSGAAITQFARNHFLHGAGTTVANTNSGHFFTSRQKDVATDGWVTIGAWDNGTTRQMYYGGGNWGEQEATNHVFYAGSYDAGAGGAGEAMRIYSDTITLNESSRDQDFRVESDNIANMLLVDAASDIVNINSGTNVNQTSLNVGGGVTISSAADDTNLAGGITVGTPLFAMGGGQIIATYGVQGTMRTNTDIILEYRATSWKSYAWEVHVSNTFGYCIVRAGGYSNGNNPTGTQVDLINGANPLSAASQVNQNNQYVRLKLDSAGSGVHTSFRVVYSQHGNDGVPKANRLFFTVNY